MAGSASEPHPRSLSPRALAITGWSAFLVAGMLFLAIAWNVSSRTPLVSLDAHIAAWLHAHGSPALTSFLLAVTHLNSTLAISAYSVVFALVLARLREWYWILTLALAVPGGLMLNVLFKYAYERVRPRFDEPPLTLTTYSFPSGHTAGTVVFYGVLAAFLVSRFYDRRLRAACASTAWLVLCRSAVHELVRRKMKP